MKRIKQILIRYFLILLVLTPIIVSSIACSEAEHLEKRIAEGGLATEELMFLDNYKGWIKEISIILAVLFVFILATVIVLGWRASKEEQDAESDKKEKRSSPFFPSTFVDCLLYISFSLSVFAFGKLLFNVLGILKIVNYDNHLIIMKEYLSEMSKDLKIDCIVMVIGLVVTIFAVLKSDTTEKTVKESSQA